MACPRNRPGSKLAGEVGRARLIVRGEETMTCAFRERIDQIREKISECSERLTKEEKNQTADNREGKLTTSKKVSPIT